MEPKLTASELVLEIKKNVELISAFQSTKFDTDKKRARKVSLHVGRLIKNYRETSVEETKKV